MTELAALPISVLHPVPPPAYGMGCATADYDNDGDRDVFLTNFGPNALYQNTGMVALSQTMGAGAAFRFQPLDVRIFVERWDKEDRFAISARERIKALANP